MVGVMIFNYLRVSTTEQNTDRQLATVPSDETFIDKVSGKNTKDRPELLKMLSKLRHGDVVNVHDLSRLARSTRDLLSLVEQILNVGASIHFHKENLIFNGDKSDPFQNLQLSMLGAISQFEREIMLSRQKEGIAIAKSKGVYRGRQSKFSDDDIAKIQQQFQTVENKSQLAREWNITRQYLYKLCS